MQDTKSHFRMRIRVVCERLIRKFGYEWVESLVPEDQRKLLVNIKYADPAIKLDLSHEDPS